MTELITPINISIILVILLMLLMFLVILQHRKTHDTVKLWHDKIDRNYNYMSDELDNKKLKILIDAVENVKGKVDYIHKHITNDNKNK